MALRSDLILALSPFEHPDPNLVAAACRAGAIGVLDLGHDREAAAKALASLASLAGLPRDRLGVRVPEGVAYAAEDLPSNVGIVVLPAGAPLGPWQSYRRFVQVTSLAEARAAEAAGADAIIAKGSEAGGRIGEETAFVLFQRLYGKVTLPIWLQGGVGLYTAAACIAGGASGVVLDSQLALVRESTLPDEIKAAIGAMDGSETVVIDGRRVYSRPDLGVAEMGAGGVTDRLGAADLRQNLLPAGLDAAFAQSLANRFGTAGGVIRAVRSMVSRQVGSTRARDLLAANSPFAAQHDIRYPIVQGPMTRVSDVAPFADAVAAAGGLPFLALSMMRKAEAKQLLEETAQRLEGRTWGVGILGFVPPELRDEQLEAIREVRPPVALIAGGRPTQAKPLEDEGIATYLHVPSPGLLDMFLKQGARRFVFEGQECGGHVGPRSSLVLWETQVERLLQHDKPGELSVIFAGGIHDARSAAMVAAMAAPLAERGARVGVLMGTAYLFTEEAVSCGAIKPAFQQAAIDCDRTFLLETAPGHSTRCAQTEYVGAFIAEKERLEGQGLPPEEVWAALELLNLGRLRIASKGLRREGEQIVAVDEQTQRLEGMVMLGQVAALHDKVGSIEDLHRDVSEGSRDLLAAVDATEEPARPFASTDVAIVGMATMFPGASDLETYWSNIVNAVNSIREVAHSRWDPEVYFDPNSMNGDKTPSKWGGFLDPVPFDPLSYGIAPFSLAAIEPIQLLSLEVSRRALADAGYQDRDFDRDRTSVIFGAQAGNELAHAYGFRATWHQYVDHMPPELDKVLPRLTEDSFPGVLTNVIAGRISNRLDLGGVSYAVDAACAASLASVDLACKELLYGGSEMVICGGADLHNTILDFLAFSSVHALSASGQCKSFDASADGIGLGEGVAAVVLKRLEDAERDGDRIYAVIKGVAGASDGKSLGLTAPRPEGEIRTLERAYARSGISPADIELLEAHGTGTVVGDRTELETLNEVFRRAGAEAASCALGSVKSQIGHTKCAAGLAGLIKAALCLYHRVLPPTLISTGPNPGWDPGSPFTLDITARPWTGSERKAGISAFGFGGTNFHAVLAEYEPSKPASGLPLWPAELFLLRGQTQAEALERVATVNELLDIEGPLPLRLRDLARSASAGEGPVQVAVVAHDLDDLRDKLARAAQLDTDPAGVFLADPERLGAEPKVAFLFPGQGSQRLGMLRDVFIAFPELQRYLEIDERWGDLIFPPTAWTDADRSEQRQAIVHTKAAQPTLGVAGLAMADLLQRLGVRPDMLAGHSYGEMVALCVGGAVSEKDLLWLSEARGQRILDETEKMGDPGTMAAIQADEATVAQHIAGLKALVVANQNSPEQTVISGATASVAAAMERFKAAGINATQFPVACAFHSPLVSGACETFFDDLKQVEFQPPALPVYSNNTSAPHTGNAATIRKMLAQHVGHSVRFMDEVEAMYDAGTRIFVEAGPGRVLTGLVSKILGSRPHLAIATDLSGEPGIRQLLLALGQLAVAGVPVDHEALYADRDAELIDLAETPERKFSDLTWWVDGHRAWPIKGDLPAHAMHLVDAPVVHAANGSLASSGGSDERDTVMLEYLQSVRDLVDTQRRVMLSYLGETAPPPLPSAERPRQLPAPAAAPASGNGATPPAGQASLAPADIQKRLVDLVSERTGYPLAMLGLDLDLEADLSIDSIKRIEILGSLAEELGLTADDTPEDVFEDLARVKTLRGIIDALQALANKTGPQNASAQAAEPESPQAAVQTVEPEAPAAAEPVAAAEKPPAAATKEPPAEAPSPAPKQRRKAPETVRVGERDWVVPQPQLLMAPTTKPVNRYVIMLTQTEVPDRSRSSFKDRVIGITDDERGIAPLLAEHLRELGASARVLQADESMEGLDAIVELSPLRPFWKPHDIVPLFERLRDALLNDPKRVLVATGLSDLLTGNVNGETAPPAGGVAGMVKSFAKEWRDNGVRVVNLPAQGDPAALVEHLCTELAVQDDVREVGYVSGTRRLSRIVRTDFDSAQPPAVELDEESVVFITGGARGITARAAVALARHFHCKLEIVGRTPLPEGEEEDDLKAAPDLAAIRRVLIARGQMEPAVIEAAARAVANAREVRATLAALRAAGSEVVYHQLDVRDSQALGRLIDDIYERHGRLDGVIHGAGIIEDKLARDKSSESFLRVFETKVVGALTLADKLRPDVRFIAFFSSMAGPFGNRGQSDYAAANDFLDKLAIVLNARLPGRVFSINWGPWADGGMVSPELTLVYSRLGIDLIAPEAGAEGFISELLYGPPDDAQVILTRSDPTIAG